jgi:hypothetical protein
VRTKTRSVFRREASRLDAPRVRRVGGLGLDIGRHLRVGVDARIRRVAGLSLDLGLCLRGDRMRRWGPDHPSGRSASLATVLAPASLPPVLADAPAPALLAPASLPPVLADAPSPALLALASHPPVLADPSPRALLAEIPSLPPAVHARLATRLHPGRARTLPEGRGHGGTRSGL